jgi:CheY-like chemotaxis protein
MREAYQLQQATEYFVAGVLTWISAGQSLTLIDQRTPIQQYRSSDHGCVAMSHPTILCIDDNVAGLASRKLLLESKGFRVITAQDGHAGLEIVDHEPIDTVILDYKMPDMDGGTVAEELRRKHPHIPILLLSGFVGDIPESVMNLVDGCLVKGSPPATLLQEVGRVAGVAPKPSQKVSQTIDTTKRHLAESNELLERLERSSERRRKGRKP